MPDAADDEAVAALYRSLPYLEAYARHTDLRVGLDAQMAIGGRWEELGALQFEYLVRNGLDSDHRMLDIGCGTLRGGRHFIRYLRPGGYTGIDISRAAIASGEELVKAEGLTERRPRLVWNEKPEEWFPASVDGRYDCLLAQSVFTHLDAAHIEACFSNLGRVMGDGARFFFTFKENSTTVRRGVKSFGHPFALFESLARKYGFEVERRSDYAHPSRQIMAVLIRVPKASGKSKASPKPPGYGLASL
jgi:SAM-dependent methyltransferase